jgi:hypothetical protein
MVISLIPQKNYFNKLGFEPSTASFVWSFSDLQEHPLQHVSENTFTAKDW